MLFKFFMKPSLMWVFHMNAGLACERFEFTLWPQLTAWTIVPRYVVAYMLDSILLIVSWSIAYCWSELSQCAVFCTTAYKWGSTNTVYKYLYTSAHSSRTSALFHQNTHCSYDKPWQLMSYHAIFMKKLVRMHLFQQQLRWFSQDSRAHKSSSSSHRRIQTEY